MILEIPFPEPIGVMPYAQFELNKDQIINLIPVHRLIANQLQVDGYESQDWGYLSDLNFIMQAQARNSLVLDNWDFEKYPDPCVIILNKIK